MWARKVVWSPVEVDYLKVHKNEPVAQLCIALAKSRNAVQNKIGELEGKPSKQQGKKNKFSRIGKRKDLGLFLRSSWEANVARWLLYNKTPYIYEPQGFIFEGIKHGTVSYAPDFLVDGSYWLEVKGMLKNQDKTRIRRFKKFYPNEYAKLKCIPGAPNTAADNFFKEMGVPVLAYYRDLNKQFRSVIPNWE